MRIHLEDVKAVVGDAEYMSLNQARTLTDFMRAHDLRDVLELGVHHGVSTCYIASALTDGAGGHVTAIDLYRPERAGAEPAERFVKELGLEELVTLHFDESGYLWRMMQMLEEDPGPRFDLCYIDGAHTWAVDGFAFFLADRLVRPGGWILFDDVGWTFNQHPGGPEAVSFVPQAERATAQVGKVYELLVKQHPGYDEFRMDGDWAFARKRSAPATPPEEVVREIVIQREPYGLGEFAARMVRQIRANRRRGSTGRAGHR